MDKEKILEQMRKENIDEGLEHAQNHGLRIGHKIFIIMTLGLIIFNLFAGENNSSLQALFFAFVAAESHSHYNFSNEMKYEIVCIAASIVSVILLIHYIIYALGN